VPQARAGKRPQVDAQLQGRTSISSASQFDDPTRQATAALNMSLNLYDSGQTAAAVEQAKADGAAARARLRVDEQTVLLNAVAAFMDVRRDIQFVSVARDNVEVLQQEVRASTDRFELGEVTRTDVSLSQAALAASRANLASTQGQLQASREQFRAIVGVPPRDLREPPAPPALPRSLKEAEALAIREHPALLAARYDQTAAEFALRRAMAAGGPTVDLQGSVSIADSEDNDPNSRRRIDTGATAQITGNLPIYSGGQRSSLQRQAQQNVSQAKFTVQNTARLIRQGVGVAWSGLEVARATVSANQRQVEAARIAFEGVREEATLGARTTLDVLNAEQDLRDAQVRLASSRRDAYVAAYQVLESVGLMTVEHLNLGIPSYNPDVYYSTVESGPVTRRGELMKTLGDRYGR